jgi:hypothetical protein
MDYHHSDSETIARAMMEELMRKVVSRPVESDGAAKAAAIIGALL